MDHQPRPLATLCARPQEAESDWPAWVRFHFWANHVSPEGGRSLPKQPSCQQVSIELPTVSEEALALAAGETAVSKITWPRGAEVLVGERSIRFLSLL